MEYHTMLPETHSSHLSIDDYRAMNHVKRWHMLRVMREQSLAEHTFQVQRLALHLLECIDTYRAHDADILSTYEMHYWINEWAAAHDADEIDFGDMTPPAKKAAPEAAVHIARLFWTRRNCCLDNIEMPTLVVPIVKIADCLESIIFYWGNGGVGKEDQRYQWVYNGLVDTLKEKLQQYHIQWPEYFTDKFLDFMIQQLAYKFNVNIQHC